MKGNGRESQIRFFAMGSGELVGPRGKVYPHRVHGPDTVWSQMSKTLFVHGARMIELNDYNSTSRGLTVVPPSPQQDDEDREEQDHKAQQDPGLAIREWRNDKRFSKSTHYGFHLLRLMETGIGRICVWAVIRPCRQAVQLVINNCEGTRT